MMTKQDAVAEIERFVKGLVLTRTIKIRHERRIHVISAMPNRGKPIDSLGWSWEQAVLEFKRELSNAGYVVREIKYE